MSKDYGIHGKTNTPCDIVARDTAEIDDWPTKFSSMNIAKFAETVTVSAFVKNKKANIVAR